MINNQEIEFAMQACSKASEKILKIYNSGEWNETLKDDLSPLTKADKASHSIIISLLQKTNLPILSEEGKHIDFNERKKWNRYWLVDPLDGTKEFIKRNGEFTINIALVEEGRPIWGVVCAPALNKTYYIDEQNKVWLNSTSGKQELSKSNVVFDSNKSGNRVVASRSHLDEKTKAFVNSLNNSEIVSMGSSLKFMMLAEGLADVYPRFAPTREWDTAAAHAILNSLGIKVYQENSNKELEYNKENVLNPGFIAYNSMNLT